LRYLTWLFCIGLVGCDSAGETDTDEHVVDTDTDTDTDTDSDTGAGPCAEAVVLFEPSNGAPQDVTAFFNSGDYLTLGVEGTLSVCPGTWFARVLLRADVAVVGLGDAPADTILSGGESGTILDVAGPNVTVTVDNVTLDRGAGLDVSHNSGGGGVYCEQAGKVVLTDVRFTNNFANDGSGLYAQSCEIELTRAAFQDNVSEDDGGAITVWDSVATLDAVTVDNSVALDGGAMGIFNSQVTINDSSFTNNKASDFGGGIWSVGSTLSLTDVTIADNVNDGRLYGGGLIVQGSATLTRVTFSNNTAPQGGGLYVYYDAVIDAYDCQFSNNRPDAIFAISGSGGRSFDFGSSASFRCAENTCSKR
jgi:predicted outer membrane repeat protein